MAWQVLTQIHDFSLKGEKCLLKTGSVLRRSVSEANKTQGSGRGKSQDQKQGQQHQECYHWENSGTLIQGQRGAGTEDREQTTYIRAVGIMRDRCCTLGRGGQ